jgi:aspartate kinase
MALIVQKYGGTSVGDLEKIKNVAKRVIKSYDAGNDLVVVLSAMAGETDRLLSLAKNIAEKEPDRRETDSLSSTGEQVTISLFSIFLKSIGYKSCSLLGYQVKVLTDNFYGSARIIDIEADKIKKLLKDRYIVVVAGFQGCDKDGNITTLGRGGSDTSAAAVAASLKADICEIYTDVDGVFTADPNICTKAQKLPKISYDEMLEMARAGAKVLHSRSVEFAKKFNVKLHVRSSFNYKEGTMVMQEDKDMEKLVVSGVTSSKNFAQITITDVPDKPGTVAKIFEPIVEAKILVDTIVQNNKLNSQTDVTITVPEADYENALKLTKETANKMKAGEVYGNKNIAKISITGVGMQSHSGVALTMFRALAKENINIILITTSEIRLSCIIEDKYAELAVRVLHTAFGLDSDQGNVSLYYKN